MTTSALIFACALALITYTAHAAAKTCLANDPLFPGEVAPVSSARAC
jgi:hypothetical protein